ncbi:MAG: site-2 protease family protein [Clostridia bacterium]|nr:site-2 protease family protein [Clostridia bacterium]
MITIDNISLSLLKVTFSLVWSKAWPILIAILFFGIIIFLHELGHFTFAKIFKVKVNEFAMGMGPAILKKKFKGTLYALRLFPIGGFVSMEGEDEDSDDENAFGKKACWKRMVIVAAGATVNILLGFILVVITQANTDRIGTNVVAKFDDPTVSSAHGLHIGDKIIKVNGRSVWTDLDLTYIMMSDKDGIMDITVKRNGEKVEIEDARFEMKKYDDGTEAIYFDMYILGVDTNLLTVLKYSSLKTVSMVKIVYNSLFDLVTGQYKLHDLAGPIGTVDYIAEAASTAVKETDYSYALFIMALITVNIGVFNLLPLPALDGGRLFFLLIELIRRKPINPKYEGYVHAAGMILLFAFMIVISASDIYKLITGG